MKILLVITETPPVRSGVSLVAGQLAAGYRRAGHEVSTLSRGDLPAWGRGEIRLSAMAFARSRVRSELEGADVVHLHGPAPTFADAFLYRAGGARQRAPIVYTHHFDLGFRRLGWLTSPYHGLMRALVRRAGALVVVTTEQYRSRFPGVGRVEVVPLGGDHRGPPSSEPEDELLAKQVESPLRVLFVGQMRPYKGVPVLLEALGRARDVTCRLIGGGSKLDRYRAKAASMGVEASFLGSVDDTALAEQFRWAQVIVLPSVSTHEAFGLVLLEGMRFGCVPVGSALPGVSEVVGDCGVMTPPGDAGALAETFGRLADDPEGRTSLARTALQRARDFTWKRTVDRYLQCFDGVLAAGRSAS